MIDESIDCKWTVVRKSLDVLRDQTDKIDSGVGGGKEA